ncbi:hypothetical protein K461DRAFT_68107 [Myriangium duriaei CBS 260.36]|uniref:Anaphase-promoting complex subunit 4 WD40 domain-containing protein n=1 Tax=Myriangium duriaei CBS 260.36 TaxID=1168546 RepID=A0A9P4IUN0_9PEZI|nr:hypothetical protein K461DRAFT_68107 [Myriangium duriaei CBS 260.36]
MSEKVIVIDALDECDPQEHARTILRLISQLNVRLFVTSRPEHPLQLGFKSLDHELYQDVILENVQCSTIRQDLVTYMDHYFERIKHDELLSSSSSSLSTTWPGQDTIYTLVNVAMPLFIVAATICRFVAGRNPQRRLTLILERSSLNSSMASLEEVYLQILEQMVVGMKGDRTDAITRFTELVGPILVMADPLPVGALCSLLDVQIHDAEEILSHLQSVLQTPSSAHSVIRPLHLSFRDFLTNEKTKASNPFYFDEAQVHQKLAACCLRRLKLPGALFDDICRTGGPGIRRGEISENELSDCISAEISYACQYWVEHLAAGQTAALLCDDCEVHEFLREHLLHWIEALSWLGQLSDLIGQLRQLTQVGNTNKPRVTSPNFLFLLKRTIGSSLLALLEDARRFVQRNRRLVDQAPLQLYFSALHFAPTRSLIRSMFESRCYELFSVLPDPPSDWDTEMLEGEGSNSVDVVVFSPHGKTFACGSSGGVLQLFNAETGDEISHFQTQNASIKEIMFASYGWVLASASYDDSTPTGIVQIWQTTTGNEIKIQTAELEHQLKSVIFTPHKDILVSDRWNPSRRLRYAWTGQEMYLLTDHSHCGAVVITQDRELLASVSRNGIITIWDAKTGLCTSSLEIPDVSKLAFSPDGEILAVASYETGLQLFGTSTGEQLQRFYDLDLMVGSLLFSPDGRTLATVTHNSRLRLWDVPTGTETLFTALRSAKASAIAFSPDGKVLASAWNKSIWISDFQHEEHFKKIDGSGERITALSFSLDGKNIAGASCSALGNETIQLWSTQTAVPVSDLEECWGDLYFEIAFFSDDGRHIILGAKNGIIQIRSARTGERTFEIAAHDDEISGIALSPHGDVLASSSENGEVRLWTFPAFNLLHELDCPNQYMMKFSPCATTLVIAGDYGIELVNVQTGKAFHSDPCGQIGPYLIDFSPDSQAVAVHFQREIRLLQIRTGKRLLTVAREEIGKAEFSEDWTILFAEGERFDTGLAASQSTKREPHRPNLELGGQWLSCRGQHVLWLPLDYRGHIGNGHGNALVIRRRSGGISFFRLRD